jgi:hypothetical protein
MEQCDVAEVELLAATDKIEALQEGAVNLRREIVGLDAEARDGVRTP